MTTYVFDRIEYGAFKKGKCEVCGKHTERKQVFWATDNPFNVNEQGQRRTPSEIRATLREKAEAWRAEPVRHARCEGK